MEKFKSFEEMSETIKRMGDKWNKATEGADKTKSYAGIHQHLTGLNTFLCNEHSELNKKLSQLGDTYSTKVIATQREKLTAEYRAMAGRLISDAKADVKALTDSKYEKMSEMLTTAPTAAQLRLLDVLKMRGDIDAIEIHNILPSFFDNYHAMRVLQTIGQANGITVNLPVQLDVKSMFENVKQVDSYLMEACEQLGTKWNKMPTEYRAFFFVDDSQPGKCSEPRYNSYIEMFDHIPQLQEVKTEKTQLTAGESEKIDWYFREVAGLDSSKSSNDIQILKLTQTVMSEHPEDLELLKLSKYGDYVREVEEAATKTIETTANS